MSRPPRLIEIIGNLHFTQRCQMGTVKLPKTLHTVLIFKKQIFQVKISDKDNFFLSISYILIELKCLFIPPKISIVR